MLDCRGPLHTQKLADMDRMLNVNCLFPTKLTAVIMPFLVPVNAEGKMQPNGKTAIINVSSFSSVIPTPFLTIYGATKGYNRKFSENQASEYAAYGVDVMAITPGFVVHCLHATDVLRFRVSSLLCLRLRK